MVDNLLNQARQAVRSARTLLSSGDPDGAVNRAYYAMFYAAQAALEHRGIEVTSSKHGTLVRRFSEHLVKPGVLPRALGSSLNEMLELRHKADYSSVGVPPVEAERAATEAEAFLEAVELLTRGRS
jgi:uncharacterized protein (UPF0332 family)